MELPRRVGGFPLMMPDICVFRESEETLKMVLEVQKVLWTVVNNSPAVVFLWRTEEGWPVDFITENVFQFGYTAEDFTSGEILYGDIIHREDIDRVRAELEHQIKIDSETFRSEHRICTKDGALRWVEERTFIQRNKTGRVTYFQGLVIDITERKAAEEAFEKAEQVKKKEINHRIKNNLQIVSSLLDLQAEKFSDRRVIEAFKESENSILSMSLIHQELYESGKLDSLDFSSYLRKLINDLIRSCRTENCKIQVNLDVDSFFLEVDTAVSLGIIINELFTNSFKYAFPTGTSGDINISLSNLDSRPS
jgi:PAS domain S-box-containing protein